MWIMARKAQPPYQEIASAVRQRIADGQLLPGEQVPSASQLATEFGVARGTALRALRLLKDEGTINVVQGWGSFVAEP